MLAIWRKELLELIKDKKTLWFVIALPVFIFPVLFSLLALVVANVQQQAINQDHRYLLIGAEHAPIFAEKLHYHHRFQSVTHQATELSAVRELIQNKIIDVAIIIQPETEHHSMNWQVVLNDAATINYLYSRVRYLVNDYNKTLQQQRLTAEGITLKRQTRIIQPIELTKVNVANDRENWGEKLGGYIPYLLILAALSGAIYPAIDLGAGEKERKTLETLLVTPQARIHIVLGKFLTILTTAITSVLITLGSLTLWVQIFSLWIDLSAIVAVLMSVSIQEWLIIAGLLIPQCMIFAALLLTVSIFASSFKEAQNYITPVSVICFAPLLIATLPGAKMTLISALIPILNVALAIKETFKGTLDPHFLSIIWGITMLYSALLLFYTQKQFLREKVLFV